MELQMKADYRSKYKNQSQVARVVTEGWVLEQIYCPNCGKRVSEYKNNKPVADFYCFKCVEDFELKSKKGKFGKKVNAGAYTKMLERINSKEKPNFFFMNYNDSFIVNDFFIVPKYFFTSDIIEKRKALSPLAKRVGWVGSNIIFSKIPKAGQIYYVENGVVIKKKYILEKWYKTVFLKQVKKPEAKGWILDIMNCIDNIGQKEFLLDDIYNYEKDLARLHPENRNIRPKIRQQLQFLRDKNYIEFLGNGVYKIK